ncbi:hypothetical protein BASA81_016508 [Batrachochytrium salamandrivorans]|nr:hypothetical protein BASA81_016508 [Batrachochytrium salamandrivorans]
MLCRLSLLLLVAVVVVFVIYDARSSSNSNSDNAPTVHLVKLPNDLEVSLESRFRAWQQAHGKTYSTSNEYLHRLANFQASLARVQSHNAQPQRTFDMGVTLFADLSDEEFLQLVETKITDCYANGTSTSHFPQQPLLTLPNAIDWRERGAVTPVKNQGQCGSCWAFATVAALEAHHFIHTGKRLILSEQQLVDCSRAYGNMGCHGGWPASALQYIVESKSGLVQADQYPYEAKDGQCRTPAVSKFLRPAPASVKVRSVFNITQNDEQGLEMAVAAYGPVTIAFKVTPDIRLYKSGVYSSKDCGKKLGPQDLTHAVTVVGFGREEGGKSAE